MDSLYYMFFILTTLVKFAFWIDKPERLKQSLMTVILKGSCHLDTTIHCGQEYTVCYLHIMRLWLKGRPEALECSTDRNQLPGRGWVCFSGLVCWVSKIAEES